MTNTTDRPVAERFVIRWTFLQNLHDEAKTAKAKAVVAGRMEGLAEGAHIVGITTTPFGFVVAMQECLAQVGRFRPNFGARAEEADAARQAYYDRLVAAMRDHDFTNWED